MLKTIRVRFTPSDPLSGKITKPELEILSSIIAGEYCYVEDENGKEVTYESIEADRASRRKARRKRKRLPT